MKDNKLKKAFNKCKVISCLLSKPKVRNCISEKHGLYRYECKDSCCNLWASYIQECSSLIPLNGYNWKIRCHVYCHSINVIHFYHVTLVMVNSKTVNFRQRMNNYMTACRYGASTDKFDNHVFKCSNKNERVTKEPYFKVYAFMIVNNENKLLC